MNKRSVFLQSGASNRNLKSLNITSIVDQKKIKFSLNENLKVFSSKILLNHKLCVTLTFVGTTWCSQSKIFSISKKLEVHTLSFMSI